MVEPYRMIVINSITLILLLIGAVFYRYVYPKKKLPSLLMVVLFSVLPVISILRKGVYESGDFNLHIYRAISFYNALIDGQVIPSWAAVLNAGYGYPVFMFDYILPNYFISLFHFLGFDFINSLKIFLIITYVLSGVFFFYWIKQHLKNELAAVTGSIFYLFTPYHLVDQHFRLSTGEISAFALFPLYMIMIQKLTKKPTMFFIICTGLIQALLFSAHSGIMFFSTLITVPYILLRLTQKKSGKVAVILSFLISCGIGLLLTTFIWLPHTTYTRFTHLEGVGGTINLTPLKELLYSPWRYGFLFQGPKGELSFLIGYTQLFVVIFGIYLLLKRKVSSSIHKNLFFWISIFSFMVFLITPYSKFIWSTIPIASYAQFSYRLLLLVAFCTATIAAFITETINKKIFVYILIFITVAFTILNWGNRRTIPEIGDDALRMNLTKSTMEGEGFLEALPKWWDISKNYWPQQVVKNHLMTITGNAKIKDVFRNSVSHQYVVDAKTKTLFVENTSFFPGWEIYIDNKRTSINPSYKSFAGRMVFFVPKGLHFIDIRYHDLLYFAIAKKISIVGYMSIVVYLFYNVIIKYRKKYEKKRS